MLIAQSTLGSVNSPRAPAVTGTNAGRLHTHPGTRSIKFWALGAASMYCSCFIPLPGLQFERALVILGQGVPRRRFRPFRMRLRGGLRIGAKERFREVLLVGFCDRAAATRAGADLAADAVRERA